MDQPVTIRSLLDAAVHFGHQTRRWNPKMKPYIFGERGGVYILDLKQTLFGLDQAYSFVLSMAAAGGTLLFVGTKKQAQEPIANNAERCKMPYVNHRWLGGMLTNFVTIRSRVSYMEELEAMEADGRLAALPKKEQIHLRKELGKLQDNLNGIREMKSIPQALFVVDTPHENIAIREARRLGIPVVGILDTNSDPDDVDFGIPGNDDAIRSVNLITEVITEAVLVGAKQGTVTEAEISAPGTDDAPLTAETAAVATEASPAAETGSVAATEASPAAEAGSVAAPEASSAAEVPVALSNAASPAEEPAAAAAPTAVVEATETSVATAADSAELPENPEL